MNRGADWEEDFTSEEGNYYNICISCQIKFVGHKRRTMCKVCHDKGRQWYDDLSEDAKATHDARTGHFIKHHFEEANNEA